jgi:putative ABC transport system permease protein
LAVSERYADDHDLTIGDAITAEFADGASQELTVAATFRSTINTGDLIITPEDWQPHAEQWGDVVVLVDLVDGVSEDEGVAAVSTVTSAYSAPEPQTRSEYIDSIGSEIDQMLYFVYGMLGVAILIALMGIANTLSLSIHERTRELGLLRAVGQTRTGVRSTIRWESVIVAVFGTVSGITLGTFLGWGLLRALADQLGYGVVDIPVTTLAIVVALAAAAGVAASWRPGRRAARMDVLDAIATS